MHFNDCSCATDCTLCSSAIYGSRESCQFKQRGLAVSVSLNENHFHSIERLSLSASHKFLELFALAQIARRFP